MYQLTAMALDMPGADLSASERSVLVIFCDRANEEKVYSAWPSVNYISERTGLNERTVRRSIAQLIEKGFITFVRHFGRAKTYRVNLRALLDNTESVIKYEFNGRTQVTIRWDTMPDQGGHSDHLTNKEPDRGHIMGVRDIQNEIKQTGKVGKLKRNKHGSSIQSVWIDAWRQWKVEHEYEDSRLSLNQKKIGMLRSLEKSHGREVVAPRIKFAVEHWAKFVEYVNEQTGSDYHGTQPDVGFFAGNFQQAFDFPNELKISEKRIEFVKPDEDEMDEGVKNTLAALEAIKGRK